jgi:kynurenine formamidase
MLHGKRWVDLTHPFDTDTPHWKGFEPLTRKVVYDYAKDGFRVEWFCHVGQWGTHVDPPAHFHQGKRSADRIPVTEMLLPLVVIDVHRQTTEDPDFVLTLAEVKAWESRHGTIPKGAFVTMRTDWSKRWPDQAAMQNLDAHGTAHYPGWTLEALKYLYEVRQITASGHETTDTDPGLATSKEDYSLETYILGTDHYQIELLANLDQVPESGALVSVTWPEVKDGSGFPARVFAILP